MIYTLIIFGGICKALADISEEGKIPWGKPSYWNKNLSWANKYDYESLMFSEYKPKFFGSTTFLVFLTDAWHLFNTLHVLSFSLAISLLMFDNWHVLVSTIAIYSCYGIFQELIRRAVCK